MDIFRISAILLIGIYLVDILPRLSVSIEMLFNNILIRFTLIMCITVLAKHDYLIALLCAIAFIQTHVHIQNEKKTVEETFQTQNALFPVE